jgi:hypothetical protein
VPIRTFLVLQFKTTHQFFKARLSAEQIVSGIFFQ